MKYAGEKKKSVLTKRNCCQGSAMTTGNMSCFLSPIFLLTDFKLVLSNLKKKNPPWIHCMSIRYVYKISILFFFLRISKILSCEIECCFLKGSHIRCSSTSLCNLILDTLENLTKLRKKNITSRQHYLTYQLQLGKVFLKFPISSSNSKSHIFYPCILKSMI